NKPVNEIAYETGFKDPAVFQRNFKKSKGMPPGKFREKKG
ncbi:MAG: helix-turn-helix domain-containing protein, partial [Fibrobacterota bacterium]